MVLDTERPPERAALARLFAGGIAGNEQLTAATGVVLILLLAALGVTILRIGQLLNPHMFLGMLLIGPVALKMGTTGYRFVRYYANNPGYRAKGPPPDAMRLLAPLVVISTVAVFATGVALLFVGPQHRSTLSTLHKGTFIVWVVVTALHVLGHLVELPAALRGGSERPWDDHGSGRGARGLLLAGTLVAGLLLALLVQSQFGAWAGYHHGGG
jgi:hypothetical protein